MSLCFHKRNLLWEEKVDGRDNKLKDEVDEEDGSPIYRLAEIPISLT